MMHGRHVNKKERNVNKTTKKNRSCGKKKDEAIFQSLPGVLQELVKSCRKVFKGPGTVPPKSDVKKLCSILDKMKPEDVPLGRIEQFFEAADTGKGTPRVKCTNIYQCDKFSLCIFLLPEKAVIPLHDHPGMTVFSKLLQGEMRIKSYDWVHPEDSMQPFKSRLARLKADSKAPCNTSVLYPTKGGNIHQFTAITDCAVLDVLGPPYSEDRDCSYYKDIPCPDFSDGETTVSEEQSDLFWLEKIEMPESSKMDIIPYSQIIENSY